jgi:FtsZ-binding cell division protein ZapB
MVSKEEFNKTISVLAQEIEELKKKSAVQQQQKEESKQYNF